MNVQNKIAIAIAVFCCSTAAFATDYNPSWYVGASANGAQSDRDFGVGDRGYGASLRAGKPVSEDWDLQLGTTYMLAKENDRRYRQNTLGADMLYLFSRKTIRPYIVFGVGAEFDKKSSSLGSSDRSSPYASAGVGVQVSLNDQWSIQADWRKVHGYLRSNDFGFNQASNSYVSLGLNYAFDKPAAPARPIIQAPEPIPVVIAVEVPQQPMPAPPARFEKITLSATELFAFDSAKLVLPQPKLDEIANALNVNTQIDSVVISGYADRIGNAKYNNKLSEQRANSVKNYLADKGINASRMSAIGKGESNPVVTCTNKKRTDLIKCLEPNRRVEIDQITIEQRIQ